MGDLQDYFYIKMTTDRMTAELYRTDKLEDTNFKWTENTWRDFLIKDKIQQGILEDAVQSLVTRIEDIDFPTMIAKGVPAKHGKDGEIQYAFSLNPEFDKSVEWNFRDVMRIPSVQKGQRLATVYMPTEGTNGIDVYGNEVPAYPGKPVSIKSGENVVYNQQDHSFYAIADGQVSVDRRYIMVHNVYQVNETLSMKDGNLDFVGSIVINGDVPTGYTVKAKGDIKIFGMVEAATLIADGSIFISGGIAGLQKGIVEADGSIHVGYINQGIVHAGNDLFVESSILHSECTARSNIYCQKGNIIGGELSAGKSMEAKDIGNRMSTQTEIVFGLDKPIAEKEKKLFEEKEELQATLEKLVVLGNKLADQDDTQNSKIRITKLKQRHSYNQTAERLAEVDEELHQLNAHIGKEQETKLIVRGQLYSNVMVAFGKYKRKIDTTNQHVQVKLVNNEITIQPL
ncbi:DUF342 domain-containing protein [Lentibacillus sp. Marseille-P4043]|uniref:DUF342 domain-containing protein n=1 Tax=Lentibacillus sp. Marseille-P4043 TaxID=2040293 RepID=UPI000D0B43EB|nr:FapA family protein [Lentibacillus sp. Marseille-P4043]